MTTLVMVCALSVGAWWSSLDLAPREGPLPASPEQIAALLGQIDAAYAPIESYRTETVVRVYRSGRPTQTERFFYTFVKPDHLRIDFVSPHRGTVLTYPDASGKVSVKLGGLLGFVKLHLALDDSTFQTPAGQPLNQTDMGTLIRKMAHSLTDGRHGRATLSEHDGTLVAEVLADDHFLPGVVTRYRFTVDEATWLPVAVDELAPDGTPRRAVAFLGFTTRARAGGAPGSGGGN